MKILNYGSLNIDHVYKVHHLVKNGETLKSNQYSQLLGGKGLNQSIALKNAGADVYHAGKLGKDGTSLQDFLQQSKVNVDFLELDNQCVSGHAIIQVDQEGNNSIIVYGGSNQELTEKDVIETLHHFSEGDYILLQNEINHIPFIMKEASKRKMVIVFNPAPFTEEVKTYPLELVDILILNEVEAKGLSTSTKEEDVIVSIHQQYKNNITIVTFGEKGSITLVDNTVFKQEIYKAASVLDTTAAGDTFIGYFLAIYSESKNIERALDIASKASSICVSRVGSSKSIPKLGEVI